jgi:CBS domain-containing protein
MRCGSASPVGTSPLADPRQSDILASALEAGGMEVAMKTGDVMTPRVITIEADAPILLAADVMLQNRISGLPVVSPKGELVGVVTEGDFVRRGETGTQRRRSRWLEFFIGPGRLAEEYVRASGRKVAEVMTANPVTVTEDTPLNEAVDLMERHRIKRLPVLRDGRLAGIITRANIMHALVSLATEARASPTDDATIRQQILAEFDKQSWAPMCNAVVRDGVVELWGVITDDRQRRALIVATENVPGVKAVRDHLVWIEPQSGLVIEPPESEARSQTSPPNPS